MAGHSKWANTKHRKDRADRKKGKIFSRIMKEIMSAVKQSGPDPKANSKLRAAIQKAKDANLPSENIERNIKKASGTDQADFTEMTYELYGYGGVGILVDILTDNKNRIASELRIATNKCGGTITTPGAVSYLFERKGVIRIPKTSSPEEPVFLIATDAGAEDFRSDEDHYLVITSVEQFASIKEQLAAKFALEESGLELLPKTWVEVSDENADLNITLIEWIENLDDVDAVFHNMKV